MICAVCKEGRAKLFKKVIQGCHSYNYYICDNCNSIFLDPEILDKIDKGEKLIDYSDKYWDNEIESAKERSFGIGLSRMAEVFYYSKIPIKKFLDIGTGPGYFLDAIGKYLPSKKNIFYGNEKLPPPKKYCTDSPNYITGELDNLKIKFDAGMSIEVIEHLTPNMLKKYFFDLSKISNDGAIYIINSGLAEYTINEDINYLDPFVRGHLVSYSVKGIQKLCKEINFTFFPIEGKSWAFIMEYKRKSPVNENITDRIWKALPENLNTLVDKEMGSVIKILGLESVRAYIK